MLREQTFRQPFRFATEDQEIPGLKTYVVVGAAGFRGQEKEAAAGMLRAQRRKRIPELHIDFSPIIQSGSFQGAIVDGKAEWLYQMQRRTRGETKPADVAGIRRNLRLDQDDVEHCSQCL